MQKRDHANPAKEYGIEKAIQQPLELKKITPLRSRPASPLLPSLVKTPNSNRHISVINQLAQSEIQADSEKPVPRPENLEEIDASESA